MYIYRYRYNINPIISCKEKSLNIISTPMISPLTFHLWSSPPGRAAPRWTSSPVTMGMSTDFHGHGGTPIAGWFLLGKIRWKWMMTWGTPISGNHHLIFFSQNYMVDTTDSTESWFLTEDPRSEMPNKFFFMTMPVSNVLIQLILSSAKYPGKYPC